MKGNEMVGRLPRFMNSIKKCLSGIANQQKVDFPRNSWDKPDECHVFAFFVVKQ
jgi:hypothetical protein